MTLMLFLDLFYKALKEFDYDGMEAKDFFPQNSIFAVLSRSAIQYNYKEFSQKFLCIFIVRKMQRRLHQPSERVRETETNLDRIRGSLVGGANEML